MRVKSSGVTVIPAARRRNTQSNPCSLEDLAERAFAHGLVELNIVVMNVPDQIVEHRASPF